MAGITYQNDSNYTSAAAETSLTINKPSGTRDGDFLLLIFAGGGGTSNSWLNNSSNPPGWNVIRRDNNGANLALVTAWKTASAEPASYTFSGLDNFEYAVFIARYTGVLGKPADASNAGSGNSNSLTVSAVTTTAANDLLVTIGAQKTSSTPNYSAPAGETERDQIQTATALTACFCDEIQAAAGSSGAKTIGSNASANWLAVLLAFKQEASLPVLSKQPWKRRKPKRNIIRPQKRHRKAFLIPVYSPSDAGPMVRKKPRPKPKPPKRSRSRRGTAAFLPTVLGPSELGPLRHKRRPRKVPLARTNRPRPAKYRDQPGVLPGAVKAMLGRGATLERLGGRAGTLEKWKAVATVCEALGATAADVQSTRPTP